MQKVSFYDVNYRNNHNPLYKNIREEIWGDRDIGITSFFATHQIDKFIDWLDLKPGALILDACCGNGEIIAYITQRTNSETFGIDINDHSIKAANLLQKQTQLAMKFLKANLKEKLPFPNESFDAIICIESIIHFSGDERLQVFKEWHRVLKPGGKLILTDPCVITKVMSNDELARRSIFGNYFFFPPSEQEQLLKIVGFNQISSEDITKENAEVVVHKWWASREKRRKELSLTESEEELSQIQLFLETSSQLYKDKKLTQYAYYAHRS